LGLGGPHWPKCHKSGAPYLAGPIARCGWQDSSQRTEVSLLSSRHAPCRPRPGSPNPARPRRGTRHGLLPSPRLHCKAWQNGATYAFIQRDGLELHLSRSEKLSGNQSPSAAYFYLIKGAAESLEAEFRAAGIQILNPLAPRPWKMKDFTISDPDGNMLHFGEELS